MVNQYDGMLTYVLEDRVNLATSPANYISRRETYLNGAVHCPDVVRICPVRPVRRQFPLGSIRTCSTSLANNECKPCFGLHDGTLQHRIKQYGTSKRHPG